MLLSKPYRKSFIKIGNSGGFLEILGTCLQFFKEHQACHSAGTLSRCFVRALNACAPGQGNSLLLQGIFPGHGMADYFNTVLQIFQLDTFCAVGDRVFPEPADMFDCQVC